MMNNIYHIKSVFLTDILLSLPFDKISAYMLATGWDIKKDNGTTAVFTYDDYQCNLPRILDNNIRKFYYLETIQKLAQKEGRAEDEMIIHLLRTSGVSVSYLTSKFAEFCFMNRS